MGRESHATVIVAMIRFADGVDLEADACEHSVVQQVSSIKDISRLVHVVVDLRPIQLEELLPLGQNHDGVSAVRRRCGITNETDIFGNLGSNLLWVHGGIVNANVSSLGEKRFGDGDCGRFAEIGSVLLEGETQDCDLLSLDCSKHLLENRFAESLLLEIVHAQHLTPVISHNGQEEMLTQIDQTEKILGETGAAETDACVEELGADATIRSENLGNLPNICSRSFTECGNSID